MTKNELTKWVFTRYIAHIENYPKKEFVNFNDGGFPSVFFRSEVDGQMDSISFFTSDSVEERNKKMERLINILEGDEPLHAN